MTVYVPVYDNGRKVHSLDADKIERYYHTPGYNPKIFYYSTIYNAEHIFTTEAAAIDFWQKGRAWRKDEISIHDILKAVNKRINERGLIIPMR